MSQAPSSDPDLILTTSLAASLTSSVSSTGSGSRAANFRREKFGPKESTDSLQVDDAEEARRRLSLAAPAETISFNFRAGFLDSAGAFKALQGISPSPSLANGMKNLSFHSAKEIEEYIEGRSSSEEEAEPAEGGGGGGEGRRASDGTSSRNNSVSSAAGGAGKSGTMRSFQSVMSTLKRNRGTGRPREPPLFQGELECESSRVGKWKTRTWVLAGDTLGYFRRVRVWDNKTPQFVEVIDLRQVLEVYHDGVCFLIDEHCFAIDTGASKRFFFKARSRAEMATWMVNLARQKRKIGELV